MKKFTGQRSFEAVNQCLHDSIIAGLIGCRFNFKFNVHLTKPIPRGLLSFTTLINSVSSCDGHKCCDNLIATNFAMLEIPRYKTVLNILEAKLLFKDTATDVSDPPIHKEQSTSHHDNNSYLYGSWLGDTVSQDMCLVSLDNNHCSSHRLCSQSDLVDSFYWRWELTLAEDEDIISDVASHLELTKSEFWTECTCDSDELKSVDCENLDEWDTYTPSFIENFFTTQNVRGLVSSDGTSMQCDKVETTPCSDYSPDLINTRKSSSFKVNQHTMASMLNSRSSLAKTNQDESLNSPHLFGECRTPVDKKNGIVDFTSPPLC